MYLRQDILELDIQEKLLKYFASILVTQLPSY